MSDRSHQNHKKITTIPPPNTYYGYKWQKIPQITSNFMNFIFALIWSASNDNIYLSTDIYATAIVR
jgi:hypothetical protein